MLKKQNRLKNKSAFNATYNANNRISNQDITLYAGYKKNNDNCPTRVGFVVSKKVHKRAVKRNRIKRLMREIVRQLFINEPEKINTYQSLILSAKSNMVGKSFDEVKKDIYNIINKLSNKKI